MNSLIKELQDIVDRKADNHELKQELSTLVKMLKIGFEKKTTGMEKVPKIFATNDSKKIVKFYDSIANQINGLFVTGNFDQFSDYLNITYGIAIGVPTNTPNNRYITSKKKAQKFKDLYSGYYIEDIPSNSSDAIKKILNSIDSLTKEYNSVNDSVKDTLKDIIEKENQHNPATVKTIDKILTSARLKSLKVEDVATEIEDKLNLQQQGIDIVKGVADEDN